jgi:hypothetical protein
MHRKGEFLMKFFVTISLAFLLLSPMSLAQTLTWDDLCHRLYDLERLATLPRPGERTELQSSYDRRSHYDEETGKYVNWDYNMDGFGGSGYIRKEADLRVLAEIEGPGCIWRTWSARPMEGPLTIEIDGKPGSTVEMPFIHYFDQKHFPFVFEELVHTIALGKNSFVPIPFQKSCKITGGPEYGHFYHFNYSLFPEETQLPSFKRALTVDEASSLATANVILGERGRDPAGKQEGEKTEVRSVTVAPGERTTVLALTGTGAITGIRMKMDLPEPPDDRRVLRELALSIRWDGETRPSAWAPLGDFFGSAPGANPYKSLPMGLLEDGAWYCYWYMPFESGALIELHNDGRDIQTAEFEIDYAPLARPIEEYGRFHAKWHRDAFLPEEPERSIDWTLLTTEGRGRYVGVMLHVWNPLGEWWGEGDEKLFVDGEKFPSSYGTGSEDYFGYAWCLPQTFDSAYQNQVYADPDNRGHIGVSRFHIADDVPFQKSFSGYIEKYFPNDRPTWYAATAFWYLAPGGKDPYEPVNEIYERLGYIVQEVEAPYTKQNLFIKEGKAILQTNTTGAAIRYTTDGSTPNEEGSNAILYKDFIPVDSHLEIKARAYKEGKYPSLISEMVFDVTDAYWPASKNAPAALKPGVNYELYSGAWSALPDFDSLQPEKTGVVNTITIDPVKGKEKDPNDFGFRYTGWMKIPRNGVYKFYLSSDDGSRLWIGDKMIFDNDGLHGVRVMENLLPLQAGYYPIRVEFFERDGAEVLELQVSSSEMKKQPLPAEWLWREE